jgi:hypothetical protein
VKDKLDELERKIDKLLEERENKETPTDR